MLVIFSFWSKFINMSTGWKPLRPVSLRNHTPVFIKTYRSKAFVVYFYLFLMTWSFSVLLQWLRLVFSTAVEAPPDCVRSLQTLIWLNSVCRWQCNPKRRGRVGLAPSCGELYVLQNLCMYKNPYIYKHDKQASLCSLWFSFIVPFDCAVGGLELGLNLHFRVAPITMTLYKVFTSYS